MAIFEIWDKPSKDAPATFLTTVEEETFARACRKFFTLPEKVLVKGKSGRLFPSKEKADGFYDKKPKG